MGNLLPECRPQVLNYRITNHKNTKLKNPRRLVEQLQTAKLQFGQQTGAKMLKLLDTASRLRFHRAAELIRFHELLLFIRAYPQNSAVLKKTDGLLASFSRRVAEIGADDGAFNEEGSAGIAGTAIDAAFSYDIVRRLAQAHPGEIEIDWDGYENWDRLGATLPRFLPLLEEDALVEANVPFLKWIEEAWGKGTDQLSALLRAFENLPCSPQDKAGLFASLELSVRWDLKDSSASRTHMRQPANKIFYHSNALLRRSDVSLEAELNAPALAVEKLSPREGQSIIDMTRDASIVRYRELYGFTYGDPKRVFRADAGRGLEIFVFGVPPQRRLPLRAYHAGFFVKNGVPIGYVETLTLFERIEIGFNLYYTFRDGESAWLYAQMLRVFRQLLGVVSCVSVDPYQIGLHNREAIESGAFWFYRKLGFRPVRPELARLTAAEEKKIRTKSGYRTSPQILKRLATGPMIYEPPGKVSGDWDRFLVRHLGYAVQRRIAESFNGDPHRFRREAASQTESALGLKPPNPGTHERKSFENFALLLALIPDLPDWPGEQKHRVAAVIEAKITETNELPESEYVRLLNASARLRQHLIRLGSRNERESKSSPI